ncbi:hypothetical protein PPL_01343 [Heterostelium album PN500]|uniref:Uncharacterized protein n=1 Tax=Heterostelium pallidum (strain ATCC 26659 / Pp 5 / PN500) TaxID=670386 RepID=D3AZ04_HETP5|nr:hypothetical protein PPL_01343 [Heterostelium album PN500]EFA85614.1 hypothetical protein PPL_01343 [Heterostelium album PN500]|eukprot:XP_020437721.1 hypothetical protein PPL_01343 [Heterostelium album PN500]
MDINNNNNNNQYYTTPYDIALFKFISDKRDIIAVEFFIDGWTAGNHSSINSVYMSILNLDTRIDKFFVKHRVLISLVPSTVSIQSAMMKILKIFRDYEKKSYQFLKRDIFFRLVRIVGDTPMIHKLMCITSFNSNLPCRFCLIPLESCQCLNPHHIKRSWGDMVSQFYQYSSITDQFEKQKKEKTLLCDLGMKVNEPWLLKQEIGYLLKTPTAKRNMNSIKLRLQKMNSSLNLDSHESYVGREVMELAHFLLYIVDGYVEQDNFNCMKHHIKYYFILLKRNISSYDLSILKSQIDIHHKLFIKLYQNQFNHSINFHLSYHWSDIIELHGAPIYYSSNDYESKNGPTREFKIRCTNNHSLERIHRADLFTSKEYLKNFQVDNLDNKNESFSLGNRCNNNSNIQTNETQYTSIKCQNEKYFCGETISVIGVVTMGKRKKRDTEQIWYCDILAIFEETLLIRWFELDPNSDYIYGDFERIKHSQINEKARKTYLSSTPSFNFYEY